MICRKCKGSGSKVFFEKGKPRWETCSNCNGKGARRQSAPEFIKVKGPPTMSGKHRAKLEAVQKSMVP